MKYNEIRNFNKKTVDFRCMKLRPLLLTTSKVSILIHVNNELLFRHIFETQIHIQTQIRKTFILALATNDFL